MKIIGKIKKYIATSLRLIFYVITHGKCQK